MDSLSKPTLAVDDRQDKRWTAALKDHFNVVVKHLAAGDFVWGCPLGSVGVEDKRFSDFAASIRNKRLDDELRRLEAAYAIPILYVRGPIVVNYFDRSGFGGWSEVMVNKALLGRQLHGVYTWRTLAGSYEDQALDLWHLWEYTQKLDRGFEGVRREKKLLWNGPLGSRAETIYGILGGVGGIRNRRSVALTLANHPLSELTTQWGPTEWAAAGFTKHMAQKLTGAFRELA